MAGGLAALEANEKCYWGRMGPQKGSQWGVNTRRTSGGKFRLYLVYNRDPSMYFKEHDRTSLSDRIGDQLPKHMREDDTGIPASWKAVGY